MAKSSYNVESLLDVYHRQQRQKDGDNKSSEDAVAKKEKPVIDDVTLTKQWIEQTDAPNRISRKLIDDLLKNEKNK